MASIFLRPRATGFPGQQGRCLHQRFQVPAIGYSERSKASLVSQDDRHRPSSLNGRARIIPCRAPDPGPTNRRSWCRTTARSRPSPKNASWRSAAVPPASHQGAVPTCSSDGTICRCQCGCRCDSSSSINSTTSTGSALVQQAGRLCSVPPRPTPVQVLEVGQRQHATHARLKHAAHRNVRVGAIRHDQQSPRWDVAGHRPLSLIRCSAPGVMASRFDGDKASNTWVKHQVKAALAFSAIPPSPSPGPRLSRSVCLCPTALPVRVGDDDKWSSLFPHLCRWVVQDMAAPAPARPPGLAYASGASAGSQTASCCRHRIHHTTPGLAGWPGRPVHASSRR